jgi:hypothetical protein
MSFDLDNENCLLDVLTELETLKGLIYQGQDVPAYRQVQKICDKIKEKINRERKNGSD